jgi:hypothetical protein
MKLRNIYPSLNPEIPAGAGRNPFSLTFELKNNLVTLLSDCYNYFMEQTDPGYYLEDIENILGEL